LKLHFGPVKLTFMTQVFTPPIKNIAELLRRLGDIPPDRVRFDPTPGTATVADLFDLKNRGCELVDGTLVEKTVGWNESNLGGWILTIINNFVIPRNLGKVSGEQGMMELPGGSVRGPDVAFISWERLPTELSAIPAMVPDFVVEVLSLSNSKAEMLRKREEYFRSGVRLVWEVDPRMRTVNAFTSVTEFTSKTKDDRLSGNDVLPGFVVEVSQIFAELDRGA